MDLRRLVFMDIKAKRFRSALKELPDEVIMAKTVFKKQTLKISEPIKIRGRIVENEITLCELTFNSYTFPVEVYSISNKIQGGVNLNVSYDEKDFGKKLVFTEPEGAENVKGDKGTLSFDYKGVHYLFTRFNNSPPD